MTLSPPIKEVSVLGDFTVVAGSSQLPLCAAGRRMVAYLAVHGRRHPVSRATLAASLWTDTAPARAGARLRSVLWRLNKHSASPVVAATADTLAFESDVVVDLWQAENQARSIIASTCENPATGNLRSDLLPSWSDDWLIVEREAFRQTRLHALEAASAALRDAGDYPAALDAALAAVQCEPLRESAHRAVLAVHLAEGNHAEALRGYQVFRRLLSVELGIPPTEAIRAMVTPLLGRPIERARPAGAPGRRP
jgi:DNA-binding SARP family transcriptional activator